MPNIETAPAVPRKDLHVFFVLDTSGSMTGAPISALNRAMEEVTDALKTLAKKNGDANIKMAVMEFNSGCKWITSNGPENMEDYEWEDLSTGGCTDVGFALDELNKKLSRHEFLDSMTGALMPVIIFMTDGYATDDYEEALARIRKNKWFKKATKIGFAIGEADEQMISSVVGNCEAVIKTTDLELFKRLIKFVSVTASTLASTSHTTETNPGGGDIVKQAKDQLDLPDDITPDMSDSDYDKEDTDNGPKDDWCDDEW